MRGGVVGQSGVMEYEGCGLVLCGGAVAVELWQWSCGIGNIVC